VCTGQGATPQTYGHENPDYEWDGVGGQILTYVNCSSGDEDVTFYTYRASCSGAAPYGLLIAFYQAPDGSSNPFNPGAVCTNNIFPQNPIALNLTASYARSFSPDFSITSSASYQMARGDLFSDAYSLNATANYRITPQWAAQFGVEYVDFGRRFAGGRRQGAGFLVSLVWQPRYDRRADARYSSARNSGSAKSSRVADTTASATASTSAP
jgi:hypothetical protein